MLSRNSTCSMRTAFQKLSMTLRIACRNQVTSLLEKDFQQEYEKNKSLGSHLKHQRSMSLSKQIQPPPLPFPFKQILLSFPHPPLLPYPHKLNPCYQSFPSLSN